jgi:hypothetical protein
MAMQLGKEVFKLYQVIGARCKISRRTPLFVLVNPNQVNTDAQNTVRMYKCDTTSTRLVL